MKKILCLLLIVSIFITNTGTFAFTSNYTENPYGFDQKKTYTTVSPFAVWMPSDFIEATRSQGKKDASSWAFSAIATIEANPQNTSLSRYSENHMRHATSDNGGNTYGFDRDYNDAGNRSMVTAYLMRDIVSGPVLLSKDPYSSTSGSRLYSATAAKTSDARVTGVIYIPNAVVVNEYNNLLKRHIQIYGAVSASIYRDDSIITQLYRQTDHTKTPNHAITLIGWDDKQHGGAFYVKDSVNSNCYWVSYDSILRDAYTFTGISQRNFDKTYEYDYLGQTDALGFDDHSAYFANVFNIKTEAEGLYSVSYFVTGEAATVEIFLAPVVDGNIETALSAAVSRAPIFSTYVEMPGYYTSVLPNLSYLNKKDGKFAVVIKSTTPHDYQPIPTQTISNNDVSTSTSVGSATSIDKPVSYISADGNSWIDSVANNGVTVCIKAHVKENLTIPLSNVALPSTKNSDNISNVKAFYTNVNKTIDLTPVMTPANANDITETTWYFGNEIGENFTPADNSHALVSLDTTTNKLNAKAKGRMSIKVEITTKTEIFSDVIIIDISDVYITSIVLDKTQAEITSAQTLKLVPTIFPEDAQGTKLIWSVASDSFGTPYPAEYDQTNPYNTNGPIALVKDGVVTPVQAGTCYVFAISPDGTTRTFCRVDITEITSTGISINKAKINLSTGTKYTLMSKTTPDNATYRDVSWTSSNSDIASVDPRFGIITGNSEGSAIITATARNGNTTSCNVLVSEKPTKVIELNKSAVFNFTKTDSSVVANMSITDIPLQGRFADYADIATSSSVNFSASQQGQKVVVSSPTEGAAILKQTVQVNRGTESLPDYVTIAEQSWRIAAVKPIKKLVLKNNNNQVEKKIILCVDSKNISNNQSMELTVAQLLSSKGTLLDFDWSSKNDSIASVKMISDKYASNNKITVTGKAVGTTKIVGINHNGNKKATVTVKVLYVPDSVALRDDWNSLIVGKSKSVKTKVTGTGHIHKALEYSVADAGTNHILHSEENPVATVDPKGKVTALREGNIFIVAKAAPYTSEAVYAAQYIECVVPIKSLVLSNNDPVLRVGERKKISVSFLPENATHQELVFSTSSDKYAVIETDSTGVYIKAVNPGKIRVTVKTTDGRKHESYQLKIID